MENVHVINWGGVGSCLLEDMIAWTNIAHDEARISLPEASSVRMKEERSGGRVRGGCWGAISPQDLAETSSNG